MFTVLRTYAGMACLRNTVVIVTAVTVVYTREWLLYSSDCAEKRTWANTKPVTGGERHIMTNLICFLHSIGLS
jgi:hypothetical protein